MPRPRSVENGAFGSWRGLLDALPDAALIVDQLGRIVFANARLYELTGHERGTLDGRSVDVLVPPDLRAPHRRAVLRYAENPSPRPMGAGRKTSCQRVDGSTFAVDIALSPLARGDETWTIAVIRDDTQRQRTEEELFRQATHDDLTGLANRALLFDLLERILRRRATQRHPLAVLFLDLDRFKRVNDTHGHAAGDEVLRVVATTLEATFRPADTIARVGGDEFVIVCEDTSAEEGRSLADRAVEAVRIAVRGLAHEAAGKVTASVGLVCAGSGEGAAALLDRADAAMYEAKRLGGDRSMAC